MLCFNYYLLCDLHENILKSQKHVHFTLVVYLNIYGYFEIGLHCAKKKKNFEPKGKILIKNMILLASRAHALI